MEVKLAKEYGFCFGVKRAIELVEKALDTNKARLPVYSIGPLIHNSHVVKKLEEKGVKIGDDISKIEGRGIVIIRTHGIIPEQLRLIKEKGFDVIDATCPFVKYAQDICLLLNKENYDQVVIIGEEEHPEVKSLVGFAGKNTKVINNKKEVKNLSMQLKTGILSQTTQLRTHVMGILKELNWFEFKETRVFDTICDATFKRQEAAKEVAEQVGVMLIIGGKNSSNTKKLAKICSDLGCETYHIESEDDMQPEWFIGRDKVGISAGASTPDWIIEKVVKSCKEL
jgi:4-hydroxy-3-methylbut-2-enyl diphosphate reductase